MTLKCPNCEQPMDDNSPYTPAEVDAAVEAVSSWGNLYYGYRGGYNRQPQTALSISVRGKRTILNIVEKIEPENMPSNEYDRQGETYKAFLIVEAAGNYYRKEAHVDSYGEETWSGPVTRVNKVEKTIQVWE